MGPAFHERVETSSVEGCDMIKLVKKAIPVVAAAGIFLNIHAGARADILRAPGGGTVRVVVIGVNHYPNLGDGAQLRGATPDAVDIAAALEKDGVVKHGPHFGRASHAGAYRRCDERLDQELQERGSRDHLLCRPRHANPGISSVERPLAERRQRTDRAFQFQFLRPWGRGNHRQHRNAGLAVEARRQGRRYGAGDGFLLRRRHARRRSSIWRVARA